MWCLKQQHSPKQTWSQATTWPKAIPKQQGGLTNNNMVSRLQATTWPKTTCSQSHKQPSNKQQHAVAGTLPANKGILLIYTLSQADTSPLPPVVGQAISLQHYATSRPDDQSRSAHTPHTHRQHHLRFDDYSTSVSYYGHTAHTETHSQHIPAGGTTSCHKGRERH